MEMLSSSEAARDWLTRFSDEERETAVSLIDEVLLVSASEFFQSIASSIDEILDRGEANRPLALYAEREVECRDGQVQPIFAGARHGRAVGAGPTPILFDPDRPAVGSEGIVANLITNLCRHYRGSALDHPGPDELRRRRAGPIIVITDFIGSGKRIWQMLEAFRGVATVRSWRSFQYIDFYVVAYSGTEGGIQRVKTNRLRPEVITVAGCPTIRSVFSRSSRTGVNQLCKKYPPNHQFPLGYGSVGALIAFEHGVPNNAPPLLHSGRGQWTPLFTGRSTLGAIREFPGTNNEDIAIRAKRFLKLRNAEDYLETSLGARWIETMLVLAAIGAGARTLDQISARTHLRLEVVKEIVEHTEIAKWTTREVNLTALGRAELQRLRNRRARSPVVLQGEKIVYYPTQLRAR
ncbi:hypothetical protein [Pseudohaliea sp.]|uniref:phosphoribosyltransferase-like protein n=1 Tax=Pseudohaliea sp. TaxID=2740289 RepID=UPI0032EC629C